MRCITPLNVERTPELRNQNSPSGPEFIRNRATSVPIARSSGSVVPSGQQRPTVLVLRMLLRWLPAVTDGSRTGRALGTLTGPPRHLLPRTTRTTRHQTSPAVAASSLPLSLTRDPKRKPQADDRSGDEPAATRPSSRCGQTFSATRLAKDMCVVSTQVVVLTAITGPTRAIQMSPIRSRAPRQHEVESDRPNRSRDWRARQARADAA